MGGTYIGIDMGTSSVKLLLTDEGGKVLGQSSRSYELLHPHEGWSEIEPETWYQSMLSGLTELMTGRNPKDVRGIGVTGQMHTLILLDADGNSVRPAILWNDKRTKEDIPFLKQYLKDCTDGEYLSGIMSTGSPASALYWVSRREPERFAECRHFLIGPDYLVYRLTGTIGTDSCEASTSCLYSISNRQWCPRMRDLIGLTDDMYPPVRSSAVLAGPVLPEIRGMFGWDERVCVITGTGDNPATALSTGCLDGGYPVLSLGTSGVLMFPVKKLEDAGRGKAIMCRMRDDDGIFLIQGVVQSTGESVDWWVRKVLGRESFDELSAGMTGGRIRDCKVFFYPHLNGDKTIYADPTLRGAFIGLSPETDAQTMFYAVMEGLCFAVRQLAECMMLPLDRFGSLKVVGGGSRNDLWMQTLANVLQIDTERISGTVGPAYGIALLAKAAGEDRPISESLQIRDARTEKVFVPDQEMLPYYQEKYRKYLRIHDAVKMIDG